MEHLLAWWRASGLSSASRPMSVDIVNVQEHLWFDEYCTTYTNKQKSSNNSIIFSPLPRETQKQKQFWGHFYQRMTPFFAAVLLPNLFFLCLLREPCGRRTNPPYLATIICHFVSGLGHFYQQFVCSICSSCAMTKKIVIGLYWRHFLRDLVQPSSPSVLPICLSYLGQSRFWLFI